MRVRMILVVVLSTVLMAALTWGEEPVPLKEKGERVSYAIGVNVGVNLGNDFKNKSIEVNTDMFMKGMKDALTGGKRLLTDDEIEETMMAFSAELASKRAEAAKKAAEKNKQDGELFLAENRKKDGVKSLPSGLQYKVIAEGSGKNPKSTDTVTVNYEGTLINGNEFDSSYRRGEPVTFPVNEVIPGWTEALQLMKEGAKWQLFIPSNLAYGEGGAGDVIGPNTTLIFKVELIAIQEAEKK
jgi:FKBP-type peptidyl-prolyl cis-trans isomerase